MRRDHLSASASQGFLLLGSSLANRRHSAARALNSRRLVIRASLLESTELSSYLARDTAATLICIKYLRNLWSRDPNTNPRQQPRHYSLLATSSLSCPRATTAGIARSVRKTVCSAAETNGN